MTVYLGKNPVGVGRIVEKKVAKEKFGSSVDNFIGDVDADGNYIAPSETFEVNLAGVKKVSNSGFSYGLYGKEGLTKFTANELTDVGRMSFQYAFGSCRLLQEVFFDGIEEINSMNAFYQTFFSCSKLKTVRFGKLKKVAATDVFSNLFYNTMITLPVEDIFPELTEISGNSAFNGFVDYYYYPRNNIPITFPKLQKIIGGTQTYNCTFGTVYVQNTVWNFPSATEFTGYIWNSSASYAGEIHFAAANQAAIEACEGYANKWGFPNVTIFFDL